MIVITQKAAKMDTSSSDPTVRLALREVREAAFRALVTRGASSSEAQSAARQVLFAEMHRGTGMRALMWWLRERSWEPEPLAYVRSDLGSGVRYEMGQDAPCDPLMHGALLVDVASTRVGSEVLCHTVADRAHLLDEALLSAASSSGLTVVHRQAGDRNRTTFATPTGDLGHGFSTAGAGAPHLAPSSGFGSRFYTADTAPPGVFVTSTAADRDLRKSQLAHDGLHVDALTWAEIRAVAAGYLVAEA